VSNSDVGAFILTHGRADRVITYQTLRDYGYTGPIWLVVDDEDNQLDDYKERYPGEVEVFDKREWAARVDTGDNFDGRGAVVYARNAVFEIARSKGLTYFIMLDDDYDWFRFRINSEGYYGWPKCLNLDSAANAIFSYLDQTPFFTIALSQGGDFIGGAEAIPKIYAKRKAMNVFFCRTDRPFRFEGRLNEDVTAYVNEQRRGYAMISLMQLSVNQKDTQSNEGGLTEAYLDVGTYVKSFYSILYSPSCISVGIIAGFKNGVSHPRIHHRIDWKHAVPKIVPEKYRKPEV